MYRTSRTLWRLAVGFRGVKKWAITLQNVYLFMVLRFRIVSKSKNLLKNLFFIGVNLTGQQLNFIKIFIKSNINDEIKRVCCKYNVNYDVKMHYIVVQTMK